MSVATTDLVLKTEDCLNFCDTFPGQKRLNQIQLVSKESGLISKNDRDDPGSLQNAFAQLGLEVETSQVKVKAEVLNAPEITLHKIHQKSPESEKVADGSWNIRSFKFVKGARLNSFGVIRLSRAIDDEAIRRFFDALQPVLSERTGHQSHEKLSDHLRGNIIDVDPAEVAPIAVSQNWPALSLFFSIIESNQTALVTISFDCAV